MGERRRCSYPCSWGDAKRPAGAQRAESHNRRTHAPTQLVLLDLRNVQDDIVEADGFKMCSARRLHTTRRANTRTADKLAT